MQLTKAIVSFAVLALANASSVLGPRSLSGEATYYGGNLAGGACSFSTYTIPSSIFGTALSDSNWDTAANCGRCVSVTGPSGNVITAMIVDECPGCGLNHLDLFPTAFSTLAAPSVGVIDVTWDYITCPITSALSVVNKVGVSAYWFSMQVVNANKGVASLEVSTDGGSTWQATTRQTYNFFENSSGFGTTTVDVKITSIDGDVVTINDVQVVAGGSTDATSNFPTSSSNTVAAAAVVESSSSTLPEYVVPTSTAPLATSTAEGAILLEAISSASADTSSVLSSTTYRTSYITRTTTRSSTTTSTSTVTYYPTSSTTNSTISIAPSNMTTVIMSTATVKAEAAATANISVLTISTCMPTVYYSVVTIEPTSTPVPTTSTMAANITMTVSSTSIPTTTSTTFTGSAASLQSSFLLAICAGLAAFLVM